MTANNFKIIKLFKWLKITSDDSWKGLLYMYGLYSIIIFKYLQIKQKSVLLFVLRLTSFLVANLYRPKARTRSVECIAMEKKKICREFIRSSVTVSDFSDSNSWSFKTHSLTLDHQAAICWASIGQSVQLGDSFVHLFINEWMMPLVHFYASLLSSCSGFLKLDHCCLDDCSYYLSFL